MRQFILEMLGLLEPEELTGTADIDISAGVYTGYVEILKIEPYTGGALRNLSVDLDLNKTTTGWDTISTASDTIDIGVFMKTDGTNFRHVMSASQVTATGAGTHATAGVRLQIGDVGPGADVSIRVKLNAERDDVEIPYRITYESKRTPSVTAVAAG